MKITIFTLLLFFIISVSGEQKSGKVSNMEKISVQKSNLSPKLKKHGISIVWDKKEDRIYGAFFLPAEITEKIGTKNIHERLILAVTSGLINKAKYIASDSAVFEDDLEITKEGIRGWFSFDADIIYNLKGEDDKVFYTVSLYTYKSNTLRWPKEK